jgi:hypothetical protein
MKVRFSVSRTLIRCCTTRICRFPDPHVVAVLVMTFAIPEPFLDPILTNSDRDLNQ